MAHMLNPLTKGLLLKNFAGHNLAEESEPLILSISSPTFDEEEDPVFQVINSIPEPIQTAQLSGKLANLTSELN